MNQHQNILPRDGATTKGGTYGAALTQNRAGHAANASRSSLLKTERGSNAGRGPQPASGKISPALRWYRRQAYDFTARGLTTKGTRRQRRPNANNLTTRLEMRRLRGLEAWNLRVNRLRKIGLTTRGTRRIYAVRRGDAVILKTQIDLLAKALGKVFSALPPSTQALALNLENQLGAIRRQL